MALKSVDGRYLKVVRELTEFRPTGIMVYYYEFLSKEDRDKYFTRQAGVRAFLTACQNKKLEIEDDLAKRVAGLNKEVKSLNDLPLDIQKDIKDCEQMMIDAEVVGMRWDKPEPLPKFASQKRLNECGFDEAWRTPLAPWAINGLNTGAFTNQNFSYECLYKELKRVFKNSFIDC